MRLFRSAPRKPPPAHDDPPARPEAADSGRRQREQARAQLHDHQRRQGLLAGRGLHQGRLDPLLPGDRALDAAVSERPAGRSDPLSRRDRGQELFPERRAVVRPAMDPDRGDILAGYRARHRLLRAGERRSNRLHGQPRRDSDSHLVVARSASRTARLAAVRYRPQRLDDARCGDCRRGSRRGSCAAWACARISRPRASADFTSWWDSSPDTPTSRRGCSPRWFRGWSSAVSRRTRR